MRTAILQLFYFPLESGDFEVSFVILPLMYALAANVSDFVRNLEA